MTVEGQPDKDRQKLMRNLRVSISVFIVSPATSKKET